MPNDHPLPERLIKHDWMGPGGWNLLATAPATGAVVFGVAVAHYRGQDGPLDGITDSGLLPDGLDGPIPWVHPDEDVEPETVELGTQARDRAVEIMRHNDLDVPATPREFADLLVRLGLLEHTADPERWRVPEHGPPPLEQALHLPGDVLAELHRHRRVLAEEDEAVREWEEAQQ